MDNPKIDLHPKAFLVGEVFYWNCRLSGKTALLAGPFAKCEQAEAAADIVGPICIEQNPEARKATFGVVKMKAPGDGPGRYNHILPAELMGELLIDTGYRETRQ
jgi:hypothetical protein